MTQIRTIIGGKAFVFDQNRLILARFLKSWKKYPILQQSHRSKTHQQYALVKNPFSNGPIKLLPCDILASLPLADTFDRWLLDISEQNSLLRDKINHDIGITWNTATKKNKKETLMHKIKRDKSFFLDVLQALKEAEFEHYDVEQDAEGLHRWLQDKDDVVRNMIPSTIGDIPHTLESLHNMVHQIIDRFKYSIEKTDTRYLFWTKVKHEYKHVKEFYSQMLFYMVCDTWLNAQNMPVTLTQHINPNIKLLELTFSIANVGTIFVYVKHANNYRGLESSYHKQMALHKSNTKAKSIHIVMNFDDSESTGLNTIKKIATATCQVIDIQACHNNTDTQASHKINTSGSNDIAFTGIEFDDLDWPSDDHYIDEKRKGSKARHKLTTDIKDQIIKPMFLIIIFRA